MMEIFEVLNLFECGLKGYNRMNGSIISPNGVAGTIRANSGGHNEVKILEPCIGAIRGRNPENPTSRKSGEPTQQMLEIKTDGTANTLTTVQKDNVVVEPSGFYSNASPDFQRPPLPGLSRTLKAEKHDASVAFKGGIRKFTPLECFRLMGFSDTDFYKAQKAINETYHKGRDRANSQLYKQAGNSIVVNVLEAIFKEMLE